MNYKELLLSLLGLSETATDAEIETAQKQMLEKFGDLKTLSARLDALGKIKTLSATPSKLADDLKALADRIDAIERQRIMDAAVRDGKLIPLHAEALPLDKFRELVASLPPNQVPLDKRTPEGLKTLASTGVGAGNAEEIRKQLGISKEQWDKAEIN